MPAPDTHRRGEVAPAIRAQMPVGDQPPLPWPVDVASKVMTGGGVIAAVMAVAGPAADTTRIRELFRHRHLPPGQVDSLVSITLTGAALTGLMITCAWWWMAWATRRGRTWARTMSTVLLGAGIVRGLCALIADITPWWQQTLDAVTLVAGLAVVVLIWRPAAEPHFHPGRPRQRPAQISPHL